MAGNDKGLKALWLKSPSPSSLISPENSGTRIDWKETPGAQVFKADLPGLRIEEVTVEIEDGRVLQISGERILDKAEDNEMLHRAELISGKFMNRFQLPENAKVDQIEAAMENGVLTVTIPRKDAKKPSIEISSVKEGAGCSSPLKKMHLPCGCTSWARELKPEDNPFSEEEIKDALLGSDKPLTAQDLTTIFESRLNTKEAKEYFSHTLWRISKIQRTGGSNYVVFKEAFAVPISDSTY